MSYSQPPPQPGPYGGRPGPYGVGQQPSAPNPYAQQPGYGYPQQAPPPGGQAQPGGYQPQPGPYAQAPGGYAPQPGYWASPQQGPYAQPGPYGSPRPGPGFPGQQPPGRTGRGKKLGVAIGAVAGLAALATVAAVFLFGGDGDGPYRLTTPQTVAAQYERQGKGSGDKDLSEADQNLTDADKEQLRQADVVKNPHLVTADYQSSGTRRMKFTGVWGDVTDPEQGARLALAVIVKSLEDGGNAEKQGAAEDFSPEGFDGDVLKCQAMKFTSDQGSMDAPACVWGDESTVGVTLMADPTTSVLGDGMSLEDAAALTAKVRHDTRVEID